VNLATADIGDLRFHGLNGRDWWSNDSKDRYDYPYAFEKLSGWQPRQQDVEISINRYRGIIGKVSRPIRVGHPQLLGTRFALLYPRLGADTGYAISQRKWTLDEKIFGWAKASD